MSIQNQVPENFGKGKWEDLLVAVILFKYLFASVFKLFQYGKFMLPLFWHWDTEFHQEATLHNYPEDAWNREGGVKSFFAHF